MRIEIKGIERVQVVLHSVPNLTMESGKWQVRAAEDEAKRRMNDEMHLLRAECESKISGEISRIRAGCEAQVAESDKRCSEANERAKAATREADERATRLEERIQQLEAALRDKDQEISVQADKTAKILSRLEASTIAAVTATIHDQFRGA